jgi:hypothetical protein
MNYNFLDLSESAEDNNDFYNSGIALILINELDRDNRESVRDQPKVLVTTDYTSPIWKAIVYGRVSYSLSIPELIARFNTPSISVFFLPVSQQYLTDPLQMFSDNEIQRVSYALDTGCPQVANKHLFAANLYNTLLYRPEHDRDITLTLNRHIDGSKDTIVQVLQHTGNKIRYSRIRKAFSKINSLRECADKVASLNQYIVEAMSYPTYPSEEMSIPREEAKTWKEFKSIIEQ